MQEGYTELENTFEAFNMILVKGGVFIMGSNVSVDEKPVHKVRVSNFWMGEFAVKQSLWAYVMAGTSKENPSYFKGANRPVENVSYEEIVNAFLPRLNTRTRRSYRLPTEAEWEYAAKGGIYEKKYPFRYAGSNKLEEVSWYDENSNNETQIVGLKTPNLLGLYDMSGNTQEWCSNWYEEGYFKDAAKPVIINPKGPTMGIGRVVRGGFWGDSTINCRCAFRGSHLPTSFDNKVGFRLVLSFPPVPNK